MGDNSDAINRIFNKLDDIGKKVNNIDITLAKMQERFASEIQRVDRLEARLDRVSASHADLKESVVKWQNWVSVSLKIIGTIATIGGAIVIISRVYKL